MLIFMHLLYLNFMVTRLNVMLCNVTCTLHVCYVILLMLCYVIDVMLCYVIDVMLCY